MGKSWRTGSQDCCINGVNTLRTGDECRRRIDTVTKSLKTINQVCENKNKEFRQLTPEDFRDRKLAAQITESLYDCLLEYCRPRSNKRMRNQGGGNPVENGVTFVSGSSTSESTDFVITSDEASQSETPLRANAVVVRFLYNAMVLKMMLCMLVWMITCQGIKQQEYILPSKLMC